MFIHSPDGCPSNCYRFLKCLTWPFMLISMALSTDPTLGSLADLRACFTFRGVCVGGPFPLLNDSILLSFSPTQPPTHADPGGTWHPAHSPCAVRRELMVQCRQKCGLGEVTRVLKPEHTPLGHTTSSSRAVLASQLSSLGLFSHL